MFEFLDMFVAHPDVYQRDHIRLVCKCPREDVPYSSESTATLRHEVAQDCSGGGGEEEEEVVDLYLTCWCYFLKHFPIHMLHLSTFEN